MLPQQHDGAVKREVSWRQLAAGEAHLLQLAVPRGGAGRVGERTCADASCSGLHSTIMPPVSTCAAAGNHVHLGVDVQDWSTSSCRLHVRIVSETR
jgi:hypothetical protein